MVFTCLNQSLACNLLQFFCVNGALSSVHTEEVVKDHSQNTGKDCEILGAISLEPFEICSFQMILLRFTQDFIVFTCNNLSLCDTY